MNPIRIIPFLVVLTLGLVRLAAGGPTLEALDGLWTGTMPQPGQVHAEPFGLDLDVGPSGAEGGTNARLFVNGSELVLTGRFDADSNRVTLSGSAGGAPVGCTLSLRGEALVGSMSRADQEIDVSLRRPRPDDAPDELEVDIYRDAPVTVTRDGLPEDVVEAAADALEREVLRQDLVALSAAFVIDGEVVDVRSYGWEDAHADVPASGDTMYRWASIAKPLTALAALQLTAEEALDLDADVRTYVPEFPEKEFVVTSRQLLCHQGAVVHYGRMKIRTMREYDVEHPWADRVLALDMFNESDLLFEPGTRYHYSTPGYSLLGAVIERAGGDGTYAAQVTRRICVPLGMSTMQPDYTWADIPHRARGYHTAPDGRILRSPEDDISWKLPAGGWISTVGDLAKFGIGLMPGDLLDPETYEAFTTRQTTRDGEETSTGLGVGVGELDGMKTLTHSGGQNKASSFLIVLPERRLAVGLMSNTSGRRLGPLAGELLELLLQSDRESR